MKNSLTFAAVFFLLITLNSCSVVEGIFKAGFWVGILAVAFVVGLIVFLVSRSKK